MISPVPALATPGWFARACERLVTKAPATPPEFLTRVENELREEIFRQNRLNRNGCSLGLAPLEYLVQKPLGIEILPRLAKDMSPVRAVDIRLFVNPDAGALDWKDTGSDLGESPTLLLLFEEIPVRTAQGETGIQDLAQQEFAQILDKNPDIKAHMRVSQAADFPALRFRREYANHKVMWIDGDLSNFKVKRSMLLALETVFQAVAEDPRYAQRKPSPPPTKH